MYPSKSGSFACAPNCNCTIMGVLQAAVLLSSFASATVSEVHICALVPKWSIGTGSSPTPYASGHKNLAILQATMRAINERSDLLPVRLPTERNSGPVPRCASL
jgi:hypothetical protein